MIFPQPSELTVSEKRQSVEGSCERCGASALYRYRVVDYRGWLRVTKCSACLWEAARESILPPSYSGDVA